MRSVFQKPTQVGDVLGVPVVDHMIVAEGRYYSFLESRRLLPGRREP